MKAKVRNFFVERIQYGETEFSTYFMKVTRFIRLCKVLPIREKTTNVRVLRGSSITALVGLIINVFVIVTIVISYVEMVPRYREYLKDDMLYHWLISADLLTVLLYIVIVYSFIFQAPAIFDFMEQWKDISRQIERCPHVRSYVKTYISCQAFCAILAANQVHIVIIIFIEKEMGIDIMRPVTLDVSFLWTVCIVFSKFFESVTILMTHGSMLFLIFSQNVLIEEYNVHLEKVMESQFSKDDLVRNRKIHFMMYKLSKDVIKAIGPILAVIVPYLAVGVLFTFYGLIKLPMSTSLQVVLFFAWLFMIAYLVLLCEGGSHISYQSDKIEATLYKYTCTHHLQMSNEMKMFILQVNMFPIRLNICDFVILDRSFLVALVGTISTYFVMLLQLFPL